MLTLYRRHGAKCKGRDKGRRYRRCSCPIWVQGTAADGRKIPKKAVGTRMWAEAERRLRLIDSGSRPILVAEAVGDFLADTKRRSLAWETIRKYKSILTALSAYAKDLGAREVRHLTIEDVHRFAAGRGRAATTAVAELERLRAFFGFCLERDWIEKNPAKSIKAPKVRRKPTEPFSEEEMAAILAAAGERDRAFLLLGRYSGLRISDVATLAKDRIDGNGRLILHQQKTGEPVCVPLPAAVVSQLESIPHTSEGYYFWTGETEPRESAKYWSKRLRKVFDKAGVRTGHFHRLRDTFAVELLLHGAPLEEVSKLLGHESIRVTERHYSPWIRARQDRLEAHVRGAWADDPILLNVGTGQTVQ